MAKKIIAVFDPYTLEHIGLITKYTSIMFTKESKSCGSFELWCDLNKENAEVIKDGNLIYLSKDKVGIIQQIEEKVDANGAKSFDIKGKHIKYYMSYRIIQGTYNANNKTVGYIMSELVNDNFISPTDENRKFENLKISDVNVNVGACISIQKTGGEIMELFDSLCSSYSHCYDILLNDKTHELEFCSYVGADRTVNQNIVDPIVISTDLKDVLNSKYTRNSSSEKNVALVAGEGEGVDRKVKLTGNTELSGVDRKEMYIDARDLSSTEQKEDGTQETLTDEEYLLLLQDRGEEKISEQKVIESFDAGIRTFGETNYKYGVDYFLGDTITAVDKKLGITVNAEVTSAEEIYAGTDGYSLNVVFGYSQPTISSKIKAMKKDINKSASMGVVMEKLDEVFQSVSSGKAVVASAITDKGVETSEDATFQTMADNITKISGGSGKDVGYKILDGEGEIVYFEILDFKAI